MTTVTITCNVDQARCITDALEFYARIGIGQIEELGNLVREEVILPCAGIDPADVRYEIQALCTVIKRALGHHPGASFGIGHDRVHVTAKRAFEIKKQIDKARAEHRNPTPSPGFRSVAYDGRIVRYTEDPDITVSVSDSNKESNT